jgi:hypothetical protein
MRAMRLVLAQQPLDANETADIERLVNHENATTARIARFTLRKLKAAASQ